MPENQFSPEHVLEGARSIRPFLPELLGEQASQVDQQLSGLLAGAGKSQNVDGKILEVLKSNEPTYYWIAEFLSSKPVAKGFERLPGGISSISARKFVCPEGDYVWYQRSVGNPVPSCPTHGQLIPVDGE